jgi:hypothetical protein
LCGLVLLFSGRVHRFAEDAKTIAMKMTCKSQPSFFKRVATAATKTRLALPQSGGFLR